MSEQAQTDDGHDLYFIAHYRDISMLLNALYVECNNVPNPNKILCKLLYKYTKFAHFVNLFHRL